MPSRSASAVAGADPVEAAIRAAVDFHVWRALAPLGDENAADLAPGLVESAASG